MARLGDRLDHDWFNGRLPRNIEVGTNVYIESAYGFLGFFSRQDPGLTLGEGSGSYGLTSFFVGPEGRIDVGPYTCLSSTALCCNERIRIGAHCLIAWGAVISDIAIPDPDSLEFRRRALMETSADPCRCLRPMAESRPVEIEDTVWIGFDAVICAGVRIGKGSVVACKTIISEDVPPYTVMAGNPARILCRLEPDDTPEARRAVLHSFGFAFPESGKP